MGNNEGLGDISWPSKVFNLALAKGVPPLPAMYSISLIWFAHPQLLQEAKGSDVNLNFAKAAPESGYL